MFESFSLLLEFGLEESILAMNEKACTGGAQFLKTTNRTLNYDCESDRSGNPAAQHVSFYDCFGIYKEVEMLRCRLERRARFALANSP